MNFCAKCLQEVGEDAVFLRNGTYMCPACYQRAYPPKAVPEKPKRIDISVEGVVTIIVVFGVLLLAYKAFDYFQHSSHDAAVLAAQERQANQQLENERQERADRETRERAIPDALAREAAVAKQAEFEAQRAAAEAEKQKAAALKAQADALALQKLKAFEAKKIDATPVETPEDRMAAAIAKARAIKLGEITLKVAELRRNMAKMPFKNDDEQRDVERSLAGHKTMLDASKATRDQLLGKLRANFPSEYAAKGERYWADIDCPGFDMSNIKSFVQATRQKSAEYYNLALLLNKALADVRLHTAQIEMLSARVNGYAAPSVETELEFKKLRERLEKLDATAEEIEATGINGTNRSTASKNPSTGTDSGKKSIVLKNGKVIPVKSFIILETEITYTDADGQSNTVSKELVDKTIR